MELRWLLFWDMLNNMLVDADSEGAERKLEKNLLSSILYTLFVSYH